MQKQSGPGLSTLFLDLNSYFASVEQQLNPELRGRPVAVVPMVTDSTSCLAASYEAKRYGVKTGTKVGEAKGMCPGLVLVRARHAEYVRFHHRVVAAVESCIPVRTVHSIDEMSCRLMGSEREEVNAVAIARRVKDKLAAEVGEWLRCSIGIAPNRFLAKVATEMQKPDGLVVIRRDELPRMLFGLALRDLPGIGPSMERRLRAAGIETIQSLCERDETDLRRVWKGLVGQCFYLWLRGEDTWEPPTHRRSVGHQHVLGPAQRTEAGARSVLIRLTYKAVGRMRQMGYWVGRVSVGARYTTGQSWAVGQSLGCSRDTLEIINIVSRLWDLRPRPTGREDREDPVFRRRIGWTNPEIKARETRESGGRAMPLLVSVTLDDLIPDGCAERPLFEAEARRVRLGDVIHEVNERFGPVAITSAAVTSEAKKVAGPRIAFRMVPNVDRMT